MNEIAITVVGNAVVDPERRVTAGGVPVTSFRVACSPRVRDKQTGRYRDGPTTYYRVTCWRELGDHVALSIVKGEPVVVTGRIQQRTLRRDDGTKITYTDIEASSVGHDLSRGTTRFVRTPRGPQLSAPVEPLAALAMRPAEAPLASSRVEVDATVGGGVHDAA